AINKFGTDTESEISYITEFCNDLGVSVTLADVFAKGGKGGIDLAKMVVDTIDNQKSDFKPLYDETLPIKQKIMTIASEIYGADGVNYTVQSEKEIAKLTQLGFDKLPVCMAKTQYSLSDDPTLLGRPTNFKMTVREVNVSAGAGFVVALTGAVMTMPGLPKTPAAYNMDIQKDGTIVGLF
ncbi:MAG: formate--tetrahydrofolate ligase, partial [Oscillospiraceae bacterium]